jgi:chromosome segregation ATPase
METNIVTGVKHSEPSQTGQGEPRNLQSMSLELQRRLEETSRALEGVKAQQATLQGRVDDASTAITALKTQQSTCSTLLDQLQTDFDGVQALDREMRELIDSKAEERSGVIATLQAAVGKAGETVVDSVEHVRDRAVAAFHRLKGESSGEGDKKSEDRH